MKLREVTRCGRRLAYTRRRMAGQAGVAVRSRLVDDTRCGSPGCIPAAHLRQMRSGLRVPVGQRQTRHSQSRSVDMTRSVPGALCAAPFSGAARGTTRCSRKRRIARGRIEPDQTLGRGGRAANVRSASANARGPKGCARNASSTRPCASRLHEVVIPQPGHRRPVTRRTRQRTGSRAAPPRGRTSAPTTAAARSGSSLVTAANG